MAVETTHKLTRSLKLIHTIFPSSMIIISLFRSYVIYYSNHSQVSTCYNWQQKGVYRSIISNQLIIIKYTKNVARRTHRQNDSQTDGQTDTYCRYNSN